MSNADVKVELLISPELPDFDLAILRSAIDESTIRVRMEAEINSFIERALLWKKASDLTQKDCADLLAWLIASKRLEIRFAFNFSTGRSIGVFHSKIGVFDFPWGDQVAFTGSANESWSAHAINSESVDVYRSWKPGEKPRIVSKENEFEFYWEGQSPQLTVLPLSEDTLEKVATYSRANPPGESALITSPDLPEEEGLRPYQIEALNIFKKEGHGVLEMATGTGKTRTALAILQWLLLNEHVKAAVITMAGNDLLNQWEKDVRPVLSKRLNLVLCRAWGTVEPEHQIFLSNPVGKILLCSREKFQTVFRQLTKQAVNLPMVVVHDEVHDLGSPSNIQNLAGHGRMFDYRLGLSATPERDHDSVGNQFIEDEIGSVIFKYPLEKAIRKRYLCPFDYFPIPYQLTAEDKKDKRNVYAQKNAAAKAGNPWPNDKLYRELARINKKARQKPSVFAEFVNAHPEQEFLKTCIGFVEDKEFGDRLYDIIIKHTHLYSQYFDSDGSEVLARFSRGELDCLVTCHKISQGIDIQSLKNIVLFSSQRGKRETIQRLGRCLRVDFNNPEKVARVIDFFEADDNGDPIRDVIDETGDYRSADTERHDWLTALSQLSPE